MSAEAVFSFGWNNESVRLRLRATDCGELTGVWFCDDAPSADSSPEPLRAARAQLGEYFGGRRRTFDLALAPSGTAFQKAVWARLAAIPFGTTQTYSEIAVALGDANKTRAVGRANGQNPISIIVPCHRVIGKSGALTGYAGGLENKRKLLMHEGLLLV